MKRHPVQIAYVKALAQFEVASRNASKEEHDRRHEVPKLTRGMPNEEFEKIIQFKCDIDDKHNVFELRKLLRESECKLTKVALSFLIAEAERLNKPSEMIDRFKDILSGRIKIYYNLHIKLVDICMKTEIPSDYNV